ncbi:MAG TPA: hypothetical protein VK034_03200 [Enhygromyxa sp.]|nr:hypothetical protein [Enhygromyxa sp.]
MADSSWTGSDKREAARARLAGNPFYVLGLRPDCARAEVEREGQKLIGMLELELSSATRYRSPIGVHRRTPELVREAMAELRDPNRRLLHELWATLEPIDEVAGEAPAASESEQASLAPFPALRALGFGDWGRR